MPSASSAQWEGARAGQMESKGKGAPLRPGIPLLLPCALALWGSSAACYLACMGLGSAALGWAALLLALLCLLLLAAFAIACWGKGKRSRLAWACAIAAFAVLGASLGIMGAAAYGRLLDEVVAGEQMCSLRLVSDMSQSTFGTSATAVATFEDGRSSKVRVTFPVEEGELYTGACVRATVSISALSESYAQQSYVSGICANATVREVVEGQGQSGAIYLLRKRAIGLLGEHGGDSAALLQALVCGYRAPLSESGEYDVYKQCGLAHIVAVSGAHLAIVAAAFGCLLRAMRASRRVTLIASSAFVVGYLVFSGIPISAVRASVMAILSLMSGAFGRRGASLNALAICIVAFVATDITACVSVSFFLSAGSTLGIVLFSSLFASWMGKGASSLADRTEAVGKGIVEPLALTLSSNIATLPFSVATFSQLPLVSPLANIVATPLFSVGCSFGLVATIVSCATETLAPFAIGLAGVVVWPLRASAQAIAQIPYGCVALEADPVVAIVVSVALMVLLWVVWPMSGRVPIACACLCCAALAASIAFKVVVPHGDEVVMLDVGQGDAILVRSESASMLIDTGNRDSQLASELIDEGVAHLDAVVVTHPDDDHCGSLTSLFQYVDVGAVVVASDMLECQCDKCTELVEQCTQALGKAPVGVDVGDDITVGNFSLEVVWPNAYEDEGGNGDSLCLDAVLDCDGDGAGDYRLLFTGDAESEQLAEMLDGGSIGDVDVLKVGHHGSRASLDDSTARALSPEVAIISVGSGNRYGHPTDEVLSILDSVGAEVHRTDQEGRVRISFTAAGIEVE